MNLTKQQLKQLIKEELQNTLNEQTPPNKKFLDEDYVAPLIKKGYKKVEVLPRLWKVGARIKVCYSGYRVDMDKPCLGTDVEPAVVLVMTGGIRGMSTQDWVIEESEYKRIIGTRPLRAPARVYAVLYKQSRKGK